MRITKMLLFAVNFLTACSINSAQSTIFQAIAQGNTKAVRTWIMTRSDHLVFNDQGQTVLHAAVLSGNRKIVKMLAKADIGLNVLDKQGKTALDCAVERGHVKISYDLVKKKALIACACNEQPLKKLIVQRMTRLYKIFAGIIAVGILLIASGYLIAVTFAIGWDALAPIILISNAGSVIGTVGMFEIAGLGITSGIRTHRTYLMNQN